jgi:hypothetical protein
MQLASGTPAGGRPQTADGQRPTRQDPMTITSQLSASLADRYRIKRHLREGGMATAFLAEDVAGSRGSR